MAKAWRISEFGALRWRAIRPKHPGAKRKNQKDRGSPRRSNRRRGFSSSCLCVFLLPWRFAWISESADSHRRMEEEGARWPHRSSKRIPQVMLVHLRLSG